MATLKVTESNFESVVGKGIVLLDFWAAWCGPCRTFAPVFEAASNRHADVTFGKVDTDAEQGLAAAFEIRSIPSVLVFRDGILLGSQPGAMSGPILDQILDKVRGLDMVAIRREIEQREASAPAPAEGGA